MERYAAEAIARVEVLLAPWAAFAMAVRMKRLERAEVERARHVAIVKGLKRKLYHVSCSTYSPGYCTHAAAMARLLHLRSFLDDVNSRVATFWPLSAICTSALALRRSTTV